MRFNIDFNCDDLGRAAIFEPAKQTGNYFFSNRMWHLIGFAKTWRGAVQHMRKRWKK